MGAPSSRMNATRTPRDGEFGAMRICFPSRAASRLSMAKARSELTISDTRKCGSNRISIASLRRIYVKRQVTSAREPQGVNPRDARGPRNGIRTGAVEVQ